MKWILPVALAASIATNAWLVFQLFDAGVTQTYMEDSIQRNRSALLQCISVTNELVTSGARREALVATAKSVSGVDSTFSVDGHLWVGQFGMDFDAEGRLVSVAEWHTVIEQERKRQRWPHED